MGGNTLYWYVAFCAFQLPETEAEWKTVAKGFYTKWQFPNCVGAIYGKHVNNRPPANSRSIFVNYKHSFSNVMMALVDAEYNLFYYDVGCNGQISDGGVFAGCSLQQSIVNKTVNIPRLAPLPGSDAQCSFVMVADDAFPLRVDIMKQYPHRQLSNEKCIFNLCLSRARRLVENAFGILANRFHLFITTVALPLEKVEKLLWQLVRCTIFSDHMPMTNIRHQVCWIVKTPWRIRFFLEHGAKTIYNQLAYQKVPMLVMMQKPKEIDCAITSILKKALFHGKMTWFKRNRNLATDHWCLIILFIGLGLYIEVGRLDS